MPPRRPFLPHWMAASTAALLLAAAPVDAATGSRARPAAGTPGKAVRRAASVHHHAAGAHPVGQRSDAMQLAARIATEFDLDPAWTRAVVAHARHLPEVLELIAPPAQPATKNWAAYRARFVEPARIAAGVSFWNVNQRWLDAARTRYGVEPSVIVGIIGVETYYGRLTGRFRVVDALTTLALDRPRGGNDRRAFFADELGHWLAIAQREGVDPAATRGSFAGAIGLGQFMPGSIARWAVDFDADGHVDMIANAADVIGSIANYLAGHGWQDGMPTHFDVQPPPEGSEARAKLLAPDIVPSFGAVQLAEAGASLDPAGRDYTGPLALVELRNGEQAAPSHVAATANFYAVTRYNRSAYYAMAVIELGQAVQARRAVDSSAGLPAAAPGR